MGIYRYVPAGIFPQGHGGLGVYIKYHKRVDKKITVKQMAPGYVWLDCPDRELVITGLTHTKASPNPVNFDEFVNLSIHHMNASRDFGLDYAMVNYTQSSGKGHKSPDVRRVVGHQEGQISLVSDSGGFQLGRGVEEFIDPKQLITWYNKNVDLGMVLDIPVLSSDKKLLIELAKLQALNTKYLLANKCDNLGLINIFHGVDEEAGAVYRDICEHPDIDRLAIGGVYWYGALGAVDRVLSFIQTGRSYKHYHILGVMNSLHVILYMRLAAKNFAPLITTDSSTHLQNAVTKGYLFQPLISHQFKPWDIGDTENFPSMHNELPCSCPVCSSLKYADVLRVLSGNVIAFMLMMHNIFATNRYLKAMETIVQESTTKDLKRLLGHQFKSRNQFLSDETARGLDFIDTVEHEGLQSARERYSYYLKGLNVSMSSNNQLLAPGGTSFVRDDSSDVLAAKNSDTYVKRIQGLVARYKSYHNVQD